MESLPSSGSRNRRQQKFARSRQGKDVSYGDPLLANEFRDGWLPSDAPDWGQSRRTSRPLRLFGDTQVPLPPTTVSHYRPPQAVGIDSSISAKDGNEYTVDLYFNGPSRPSIARSFRRQTPARTTSAVAQEAYLRDKNPAKDLGGIFSYGCCCAQCVRTQEVGVSENFGQFEEILEPGCYCMMWPFKDVAGRLSLRIQQLNVVCETKTKDNVFLHVQVSVQYRVIVEQAYDAYYRLTNPQEQINAYVFDVVRSSVPRMAVDQVFLSKATIASSVMVRLEDVMNDYGYEIISVLVTDLSLDPLVKASMNEIEVSKRLKLAAPHQAEADKVMVVKRAEAAAESMYLSGLGTASERVAISKGMKQAIKSWTDEQFIASKDVMDLLLITQYMDTLAAIGANGFILRSGPGEVAAIQQALPTTHNIPDLLS